MKVSLTTLFTWVISIAAMGAIAVGISLIGSPQQARMRKLDEQRVSDLRRISTSVGYYRKAHDRLPDNLEQLNLSEKERKDAVTGQLYEYKIHDADSYDLCAVFDTIPGDDAQSTFNDYGTCSVPWRKHNQGRYCFTISAKACR